MRRGEDAELSKFYGDRARSVQAAALQRIEGTEVDPRIPGVAEVKSYKVWLPPTVGGAVGFFGGDMLHSFIDGTINTGVADANIRTALKWTTRVVVGFVSLAGFAYTNGKADMEHRFINGATFLVFLVTLKKSYDLLVGGGASARRRSAVVETPGAAAVRAIESGRMGEVVQPPNERIPSSV